MRPAKLATHMAPVSPSRYCSASAVELAAATRELRIGDCGRRAWEPGLDLGGVRRVGAGCRQCAYRRAAWNYNSTEFGVPTPGTTPPKYAWLGAAGISSELSLTGRIVQEGIAYVPQLGWSLQAPEDLAPTTPTNSATPTVAAQEVAQREQENVEATVSCENPAKSQEYRSWVWAHVWGPGLHNVTGWGVSDVRWAGAACEPTTHGPGTE